jgi:hypothetical protein
MDRLAPDDILPIIVEENQSIYSSTLTQIPLAAEPYSCIKLEKVIEAEKIPKKKKRSNQTLIKASQGYKDANPINPAKVFEEFESLREKQNQKDKKFFMFCC